MTTIHLGFEVGTGHEVKIPLAHTFVTGQTQLSGKTTTLRAIVERSGKRALAFITKRGERFDGRRIPPYLPREGEQPIHWRLVETILASALGQRSMKYERFWLIQAAKGATSLAGVRSNVVRLLGKSKGGRTEEAYTLIREYLDLVVPEMQALGASDELVLEPGLNVMDLAGVGLQLQSLVIRAAMEQINRHEHGVLTVFPEAWEFAPRSRSAPAKDEAIAMARKGAAIGNYLLCDSQDLAGVDTVVRQAASVWILGVQRELNELKRTIQMIPAGIKRPKPEDVATLELGQFFACWGKHAVKTYVWPAWMTRSQAEAIAIGLETGPFDRQAAAQAEPAAIATDDFNRPDDDSMGSQWTEVVADTPQCYPPVTTHHPPDFGDDEMSAAAEAKLDEILDFLKRGQSAQAAVDRLTEPSSSSPAASANGSIDEEQLYQRFKARLAAEAPAILKVLLQNPKIQIDYVPETIEVDGKTLRGRLARLIKEGLFDEPQTTGTVSAELTKRGFSNAASNVSRELGELAEMGFLTRNNKWWQVVESMKQNVVSK